MKRMINGLRIEPFMVKDTSRVLGEAGEYRAVTKCRGGFMTIMDMGELPNPLMAFNRVRPEALYNLQYKPNGVAHWYSLYVRKGNKLVSVDESLVK